MRPRNETRDGPGRAAEALPARILHPLRRFDLGLRGVINVSDRTRARCDGMRARAGPKEGTTAATRWDHRGELRTI